MVPLDDEGDEDVSSLSCDEDDDDDYLDDDDYSDDDYQEDSDDDYNVNKDNYFGPESDLTVSYQKSRKIPTGTRPKKIDLNDRNGDVDKALIIHDINYPGIYVRKLRKYTGYRVYDLKHACLYCKELVSRSREHMQEKHPTEERVEEILKLNDKIRRSRDANEQQELAVVRRNKTILLRLFADHQHNSAVKEAKEGEIIISRRSDIGSFDIGQYGHCTQCFEWVKLPTLEGSHVYHCPALVNNRISGMLDSIKSILTGCLKK